MNKTNRVFNFYFVLILVAALMMVWFASNKAAAQMYTKGVFEADLKAGKVLSVEINPNKEVPTGVLDIEFANGEHRELNVTDVNEIQELLKGYDIDPVVQDVPRESLIISYGIPILSIIAIAVLLFFMMNAGAGGAGGGKMMNFGKSRAKLDTDTKTKLDDVAGLKEEKEDLEAIAADVLGRVLP